MKKSHLITTLLLSSMVLIPNTTVFATTNDKDSKDVQNNHILQTDKLINGIKDVSIPPFSSFTKYDWSTSVNTSPYKWYKVNGHSKNNGNFNLKNREGTHYKSLHISWSSSVNPKDMKVKIYNNTTGGSVTHSVSGKVSGTTFTDLKAGNYTVYIITGNYNNMKVSVTDYNPSW